MALVSRRPHYPLPRLEEGLSEAEVGFLTKLTTELYKSYNEIYLAFLKSWHPTYKSADVSNPPTDVQLTSVFGAPSAVGAGFTAILNDAGLGIHEYFIWSDGSQWWWLEGTKAV